MHAFPNWIFIFDTDQAQIYSADVIYAVDGGELGKYTPLTEQEQDKSPPPRLHRQTSSSTQRKEL